MNCGKKSVIHNLDFILVLRNCVVILFLWCKCIIIQLQIISSVYCNYAISVCNWNIMHNVMLKARVNDLLQ